MQISAAAVRGCGNAMAAVLHPTDYTLAVNVVRRHLVCASPHAMHEIRSTTPCTLAWDGGDGELPVACAGHIRGGFARATVDSSQIGEWLFVFINHTTSEGFACLVKLLTTRIKI